MTQNKKHRSTPPAASTPAPAPPLPVPAAAAPPLPVAPGASLPASGAPLEATVNLAPAAAAKLGAEASERTATAMEAENALPGWQSLGRDHKPTHANGKQGRREKKVRW